MESTIYSSFTTARSLNLLSTTAVSHPTMLHYNSFVPSLNRLLLVMEATALLRNS